MDKHVVKSVNSNNSAGMRMSDGDWVCSDFDCGNVNFSRRTSCNRCGKERAELKLKKKMGTEIGKSAADKSRGLFSADDWQCNKCANVNWARRQTCNVCNAPKFGEVEARTGYGGGYNERGTVEYRPRRDSDDDEYDEFGRRKKKKNKDHSDKVMSVQKVQSYSASSQPGDVTTFQHSTYKKPTAIIIEDPRMAKNLDHNSDNRSADYLRESRYSRSSENSVDLLRKLTPARNKRKKEDDIAGERSAGRISDWVSKKCGNLSSPRDCIMENRVSSTNEIKYRFTGKTIDENFEVIYTLEERVCAAAWAIAYMNCRMSAEQFQTTFDKPAPDFKTVFAWRQRLLLTGCLVDNHTITESSDTKGSKEKLSIRRKLGRRKRARYYEQRGETTESSSDERHANVFKRKVPSSKSSRSDNNKVVMLEMSSHDDTQVGQEENKQKTETDNSDETNSDSKGNQSSEKRDSSNKPVNEYDSYLTDPTRSMTPELTNLRIDLANIVKSPHRKAADDKQFAEDVYFEDDIVKSKAHEDVSHKESQFLKPDVPKNKKVVPTKSVEDSLKSVLEDIISESERYSSDDASEIEDRSKTYPKSNTFDNKYQPSFTAATKSQTLDLPLPKFAEHKLTNSFESTLQGCSKNMSSAMRRLYETMNSQSKGSDGDSGLEYVPTKINPAMAKKNHHIFNNDVAVESANDMFSDNSTSICDGQQNCIPAIKASSSYLENTFKKKSNVFKIQMFEDYVPEDDALYKDGSSEGFSDKNDDSESGNAHKVVSVSNIPMPSEKRVFDSVSLTSLDKPEGIEIPKVADKGTKNVINMASDVSSNDNTNTDGVTSIQTESIFKVVEVEEPKKGTNNEILNFSNATLSSLLNINLSNINTDDLAKTLKQIQALAEVVQHTKATSENLKMEEDKSNEDCLEVNINNDNDTTIVIDDIDEPKPPQPPSIPFLSDMFDPGTPPNSNNDTTPVNDQQSQKIPDLLNVQETNLDDLLDLPPRPITGFKSFAIPKPIMLNRLKIMNNASCDEKNDASQKSTGKKKKRSKNDDNEGAPDKSKGEEVDEEEESGDDGDLSKYDLWGEEDPNADKPEAETSTNSAETTMERKIAEKSSVPNNENKRSRSPKKSSGSTSRSSSSSSSSSESSSGPAPRNRYDDFNLNSEQSRAESADSSRSRSNSRERKHHSGSRNDRKHRKHNSEHGRDRKDRHSRMTHHSGRDLHRKESDRRLHNSHRHRR